MQGHEKEAPLSRRKLVLYFTLYLWYTTKEPVCPPAGKRKKKRTPDGVLDIKRMFGYNIGVRALPIRGCPSKLRLRNNRSFSQDGAVISFLSKRQPV